MDITLIAALIVCLITVIIIFTKTKRKQSPPPVIYEMEEIHHFDSESTEEDEEPIVRRFTAKHTKFLTQPFADCTKLGDLPAIGAGGKVEGRFTNKGLRYPFRVFGKWMLDGDDDFYDYCLNKIKMAQPDMPKGTAAELCDAFGQKWAVMQASGTDIDELEEIKGDASSTQKGKRFELASFASIDRKGIADVVPGIGDATADKFEIYLNRKLTTRELMGLYLTKRSNDGSYKLFINLCSEIKIRKQYALELAEALEQKWTILSRVI